LTDERMHGMQTRYTDEKAVRLSVRLSLKCVMWQNGLKICSAFHTTRKNI